MIAKESKKGGSTADGLCYILGGSKDEPQHAEIVMSSEIIIPRRARRIIERINTTETGKATRKKDIRKIARALAIPFDLRARKAGPKVNMPNQGYIVSFAPEDRDSLTPKLKQQILEEFLQMIGVHGDITVRRRKHKKTYYEKVHREAMFIAVGHTETNCYHWHIFASRIDSKGRANETSFEHRRIVKACTALSKKYGIRMDALQDSEVNLENVNPGYYNKVQVRQFVKEALSHAKTWKDFEDRLTSRGIVVLVRNKAEHGKDGVCFQNMGGYGEKVGKRSHTYSGSQLSKDLTLPKIHRAIEDNALKRKREEGLCAIDETMPVICNEIKRGESSAAISKPVPVIENIPIPTNNAQSSQMASTSRVGIGKPIPTKTKSTPTATRPSVIRIDKNNWSKVNLPKGVSRDNDPIHGPMIRMPYSSYILGENGGYLVKDKKQGWLFYNDKDYNTVFGSKEIFISPHNYKTIEWLPSGMYTRVEGACVTICDGKSNIVIPDEGLYLRLDKKQGSYRFLSVEDHTRQQKASSINKGYSKTIKLGKQKIKG